MTGEELHERILDLLGLDEDDFDEDSCLYALNRFFEDLLLIPQIKVIGIVSITVETADIFYEIPLKIFRVYKGQELYYDWEQVGNSVSFKDAGDFDVCYLITSVSMDELVEDIPVSGVYLPAAEAYVKHCYWEMEDEMDKADYFEEQFQKKAMTAYNKFKQDFPPATIRTKRR